MAGAPPKKIGVAVSGGGDSMALLDLLRCWGRAEIFIASVNHGLRAEAAEEVQLVANYAAAHGLHHDSLTWQWDGTGNLQQAAREGRQAVLRDWAVGHGIAFVALGHTADDQAETFLMRLARGSGVDGLAAMAAARDDGVVTWLRPLLEARREDLRVYLLVEDIAWADDPSNADTQFDRVKARQMMETLAPLGLTHERLVQTAAHMAREREVLAYAAAQAKARCAWVMDGDVVFERGSFEALPEATRLRVMADALCFVSGASYRPRFRALAAALKNEAATALHGCLIVPKAAQITVTREGSAVRNLHGEVGDTWDGRWQLVPPDGLICEGLRVAALGETGLAQCEDWRASGRPRASLLASPAVWDGDCLVAAPMAGQDADWRAELVPERSEFA